MANIAPDRLVLRCYGYRRKDGMCFGVCLDLNLAVEADSEDKLKKKMNEVIVSYLETVLDTEDKASIPDLISRRAPIHDWLIYYLIHLAIFIRQFPGNFTFKEIIPFHLAHSC